MPFSNTRLAFPWASVVDGTPRKRRFTEADCRQFAAISGDFNPLHLDPVLARRTLFGGPVVHGMLAVAWALDQIAEGQPAPVARGLADLTVHFRKPIRPGDRVELHIESAASEDGFQANLRIAREKIVELGGHYRPGGRPPPPCPVSGAAGGQAAAKEYTLSDLPGLAGNIDPAPDQQALAVETFPNAALWLGGAPLARLLALSRLVGMEAPGLHSLFAGFSATFVGNEDRDQPLGFRVEKIFDNVGMVRVAFAGGGLAGHADAFMRPSPHRQPAFTHLAPLIEGTDLSGQRVLVVGGSRGLGEVLAKLTAAAGADVVITYRSGAKEAGAVGAEISAAGGHCRALRLDADSWRDGLVPLLADWRPDQFYYLPTPRIFGRAGQDFDEQRYRRFREIYVERAGEMIEYLLATGGQNGKLRVFYPSSVSLDEETPELAEYSSAKRAGEDRMAALQALYPGLRAVVERLPRLKTDQTMTLRGDDTADVGPVLARVVRQMAAD